MMINNENTVNKVYNKWFDSPYYHILYENRDYKEAKKFVKTIINHLKLKKVYELHKWFYVL